MPDERNAQRQPEQTVAEKQSPPQRFRRPGFQFVGWLWAVRGGVWRHGHVDIVVRVGQAVESALFSLVGCMGLRGRARVAGFGLFFLGFSQGIFYRHFIEQFQIVLGR